MSARIATPTPSSSSPLVLVPGAHACQCGTTPTAHPVAWWDGCPDTPAMPADQASGAAFDAWTAARDRAVAVMRATDGVIARTRYAMRYAAGAPLTVALCVAVEGVRDAAMRAEDAAWAALTGTAPVR